MKVVFSCDANNGYADIEGMADRSFKSFREAIAALKPRQTLTLEVARGYKQVGVDEKGRGWVQRYAAPEY